MPWFAVIPMLPIILAYLAGAIVALVLALRYRSLPAALAMIGFAIFTAMALFNMLFRAPLIEFLVLMGPFRDPIAAHAGLGCCCSILDVVAVMLLVIALWQAVTGRGQADIDLEEY